MSEIRKKRIPWRLKGIFYEVCAAEGQCPIWLGRDLESPCKSFQVIQLKEGSKIFSV